MSTTEIAPRAEPHKADVPGTKEGPSARLKIGYYLDNFMQVVEDVRSRYGFLLSLEERRYLGVLDALSVPAQMLYARLVNRRGPCFRLARLSYPEIKALDLAIAELLAAGLLEPCDQTLDRAERARLFACFTQAELKEALGTREVPKLKRKDALLDWLGTWGGCDAWLAAFLAEHPVVRIAKDDPWPFLRFLFFGELRDNLSDFVTRALGHVVTESVEPEHLKPHFTSRRQADDAYRMATLYVAFRHIRDSGTAAETLSWWQSQEVDRATLLAGTEWLDRLVDRLGYMLEREKQLEAALALYETSSMAPARERRVRLLLKFGRHDEAKALLRSMQQAPCHAEEAYAARQLLARLEKTSRRSEARHYQRESRTIILDYPDAGVEAAVLAHYRDQGWQGVHSENWLWNASFGLLLWDIIFDPAIGVFHSPLQFAPSDLHEPTFYLRRRSAIEARLAMLAEPTAAFTLVTRFIQAKRGISNPFVSWHDDLPELLHIMLHRLPPAGHAAALRHLAQDVRHHSRGLPDLFLWSDTDYRFVEIKAENDQLAPHQYEWLRVLGNSGVNVRLEKVQRPIAQRPELAAIGASTIGSRSPSSLIPAKAVDPSVAR